MSPLRKQMQADMVLRGLAARTQEAYIAAVAGLAGYYNRSPEQLSQEDVQQYLLHLIEARKLSWSTTNQAACALRFLFHITLKQPTAEFTIPNRKAPARLPEILSRDEVHRILDGCSNLRHRALLMTTYAAGLRVTETCRLKVGDIDSERMMLRVANGKGGKDRYTLLSAALLDTLRQYWRTRPSQDWLFPRTDGRQPIGISQVQKMYYAAKRRAHVTKAGGIHGLRHAFATHLLEAGVDIHTIGRLMGHDKITTTARYLHLQGQVARTDSPLDLLSSLLSKR
ncbi:tyrosine-type recombinase/integrase [Noviherbaspirillum sedimenti]|uniref:Integrase n=1 Tax=Noviherbaspirillum sedimenti TaxID=2320865 RepID=A0A3A3GIS5_9BURK|nr:site-specific integrase [Noviherbaspirillum sedimenti]RJG02186.1 integrase [Noviherbaspirillum sedimenti]